MPTSPADKGFGQGSPELARWAERVFRPEDDVLREIRARSVAAGLPAIAVGRMDGLHLEILARAAGARRAVEIGTLGGYSGVCLLRGMPDGRLDTFELEPGNAAVARDSFEKAGVAARVRIHVGRAVDKLREIEGDGPFDLVFIDADKSGYPAYLTWAEEHLRPGGIVLLDNAFGWGDVADPAKADHPDAIAALASCAERLGAAGGRWRGTMIPTEEGLAIGVKVR
ncbi:MAG: O-methyltransferase [Myxococcales bacterium]|nr:O-methyltransferase [Myxococcales bacterium]